LDIFGEHAVQCDELLDFKYTRDFVRDAHFDMWILQWDKLTLKARKAK